MGKVDGDTMQDFICWLCRHEDDIKHGINDFCELRELFKQLIGREAGQVVTEEPW